MNSHMTQQQIIEAADMLFYEKGFEHTSFAHIAEAVKISRGNFYYHFKTKDDILNAVIKQRLTNTQAMLDQWHLADEDPAERIKSFIHILIDNQTKIMRYGCPVGTLSAELAKLNHPSQKHANKIFSLFHIWLGKQFCALGLHANADFLAQHLLARSQGVATLANAFRDKKYVQREVQLMCDWLDETLKSEQETAKQNTRKN